MPWHFRKSVKLFPGIRLNFSQRGISTTVGPRGANLNISSRGTHLNLGIPGTGLHSRTKLSGSSRRQDTGSQPRYSGDVENSFTPPHNLSEGAPEVGEIKSAETEALTSDGLMKVKETLLEAFQERAVLQGEVGAAHRDLEVVKQQHKKLANSFLGRMFRKTKIAELEAEVQEKQAKFDELNEQLGLCVVKIETNFDERFAESYGELARTFGELASCAAIWDTTSSVGLSKAERSFANQAIQRTRVAFGFRHVSIVNSETPALHMSNANGGDLYLYPGFLVVAEPGDFALVDYRDVLIEPSRVQFVEEQAIQPDSKVVGKTWAKVNKSGSPDLRFKDNYQIPLVAYGQLHFRSQSGLNEVFLFSNDEKAHGFSAAFDKYKSLMSEFAV